MIETYFKEVQSLLNQSLSDLTFDQPQSDPSLLTSLQTKVQDQLTKTLKAFTHNLTQHSNCSGQERLARLFDGLERTMTELYLGLGLNEDRHLLSEISEHGKSLLESL